MFRRKRKDDDIGPSTGLMKLAKNFFRFILFPFIYPKRFLIILLVVAMVIFVLPASFGIEFNKMGEWYEQQIIKYFEKTEAFVEKKLKSKPVEQIVEKVESKILKKEEKININNNLGLVEYNVGVNAKRKLLAQNEETETKETKEETPKETLKLNETVWVEHSKNEENLYAYKKLDNLGLNYLDSYETVSGVAEIVTPNEFVVNGKRLFLYGIYVLPNSKNNVKATKYAYENYEGKDIECRIIAYSKENVATAVCVYNGESINHKLVDLGYSENIALY